MANRKVFDMGRNVDQSAVASGFLVEKEFFLRTTTTFDAAATTAAATTESLQKMKAAIQDFATIHPSFLNLKERPLTIAGLELREGIGSRPKFVLDPNVPMSDEFRQKMQAWCNDFFGMTEPMPPRGKVFLSAAYGFAILNPLDLAALRYVP
jgi:hypothetical protein